MKLEHARRLSRSTDKARARTSAFFAGLIASISAISVFAAPSKITLRGQVVCSGCWDEADREKVAYGTKDDLACAIRCAKKDIRQALAVSEKGGHRLYLLEPPRTGTKKNWLDFVAQEVEATGSVRQVDEKFFLDDVSLAPIRPAAPPIEARELTGKSGRLSDYRGKIVVLNFWASWCAPCRKEMPILAEASRDYSASGIQFVGYAGDGMRDRPALESILKETGVTFPIWLGANGGDLEKFGLPWSVPATVFIDREGRVASKIGGVISKDVLRAELDRLIKEGEESFEFRRGARSGRAVQ